jgi:hypothetical protein
LTTMALIAFTSLGRLLLIDGDGPPREVERA